MPTKTLTIIVIILILIIGGGAAFWFFFMGGNSVITTKPPVTTTPGGFQPFGDPIISSTTTLPVVTNPYQPSTSTLPTYGKILSLRLLSDTPVGGFGASTTASSTIVRWVDRGRGNVFEANSNNLEIKTISNTVVPMIYASSWNKNLTAFIGSFFEKDSNTVPTIYAELTKRATSTISASSTRLASDTSSFTDYQLKGKNLPNNTIGFAVSPKKDKVFILVNESGQGVGYISGFDGKTATKIFSTPLTQLNVDWPSDSVIALTTKGSASYDGYLYFVDPKTGSWKKVYGPAKGLSAKVSHDAKKIFISTTKGKNSLTSILYTTKDGSETDAVIRTLAEKCAWGNFAKEMIYCATPFNIDPAVYPDSWYTGASSFVDKVWQINTNTEEVHLVSQITNQADRVIDGINLELDSRDDFLFFMNKNDLSLWSLDLVTI